MKAAYVDNIKKDLKDSDIGDGQINAVASEKEIADFLTNLLNKSSTKDLEDLRQM